jgi:hypothetical protein
MVSMRYPMPHFPCEFEIPDDWIAEAGAQAFPMLQIRIYDAASQSRHDFPALG